MGNKPRIRFKGFTEDWEQCKLSDISSKVTIKNVDVLYTETLTNSAEQGIISQVDFFDKEISNKDNINGYYIVDNNDFIYNPRISTLAPVGPINRNKLNRTGIISPLYTVFRSSNVDLGFLEWYFQSSHWHRYMKLNGDSGARADRIAIKDSTFFEMPIKIPVNIKEQVLIGETLEKFNQYITLHQCKLEKLKLTKKALLQKLFPKNGKHIPEIRFKGLTDAWEQREFSDIFAEVKSGLSRMLSNDDIGLPVVRANNINDGQLNLVDDIKYWYKNDPQGANTNNYLIEQGDILINFINSEAKMGTAAYVTRRPERDTIYTTNILRCKVNDEYNPYFIYSLTFLNSYKNYIASITKPAVNQASFTTVDFKKYSIKIPTVKEQNQIADLIETFNKLITLHQRKLERLQEVKKGLLQKMFV